MSEVIVSEVQGLNRVTSKKSLDIPFILFFNKSLNDQLLAKEVTWPLMIQP